MAKSIKDNMGIAIKVSGLGFRVRKTDNFMEKNMNK